MEKKKTGFFKSIKKRDPAARNWLEILILYPGVHALIGYRIAHFFHKIHLKFIARVVSQLTRFFTQIEIHPGATIGKALFIDHGCGVVIGETSVIGDYVTLYQGVTLGGTGKEKGKRHPTLGDNVMVGAGAKVLGPFVVGDNARIAAGAVVLDEVPPGGTAVGVPARVIKIDGQRVEEDFCENLDQIHVPDPVEEELCKLKSQLETLNQKLEKLEKGEQ